MPISYDNLLMVTVEQTIEQYGLQVNSFDDKISKVNV